MGSDLISGPIFFKPTIEEILNRRPEQAPEDLPNCFIGNYLTGYLLNELDASVGFI
jgi:hypothetical protein